MSKRLLSVAILIAAAAAVALYVLTEPLPLDADTIPAGYSPDIENGRYLFWAGGCSSCHAVPCASDQSRSCAATDEEKFALTGGVRFTTPFGTFHAPNISPHPEAGIGGWPVIDFVNAMKRGITPGGSHYYPVFPYASYQRMPVTDLVDLKAFLDTLPAVSEAAPPHDLDFPFNIRRGLGLWKLLAVDGETFAPAPEAGDEVNRGAYLVNGPGHCGECHTPRGLFGIDHLLAPLDRSRWLAGAPNPDGEGIVPNITPHQTGIGSWSEQDIAYALESGFDPSFDTLGGTMAKVQENMARLTPEDRAAIAAYLKSIPPVASPEPAQPAGR